MRTVYACLFDVAAQAPDGPGDTVTKLWRTVLDWIESHYREGWQIACALPADEGVSVPLPDHSVAATRAHSGVCELRTLDWQYPDRGDATLCWSALLQVARNGPRVEAAAALRVASTKPAIKPLNYTVTRPAWLDRIFDQFACSSGRQRIQRAPVELDRHSVGLFVDDVLCDRQRGLPVVAVTPEQGVRDYIIDPAALQAALLGHAQVVALRDHDAGFALTDALGRKELSCYLGAARLYWPGFARSDPPETHPLYLGDSLRKHAEHGQPLAQYLARMLIGISGFRMGEPPIARLVRQVLEAEKKERIQRLLARAHDDQETREILHELERSWDESAGLRRERDQARTEAAELNRLVESLRAELAERGDVRGKKQRYLSVAEVVVQARDQFAGTLVFLQSALDSAADSPYQQPDKVYGLLQALDDLVRTWQQQGSLGRPWYDALKQKGFEYKEFISDTSLNRYGDEYHFPYKGQRVLCQHHITLGVGSPNMCLSVHWARDDDAKRILIGWIGRHRTNTLS
jgi:hypothetical protein